MKNQQNRSGNNRKKYQGKNPKHKTLKLGIHVSVIK